MILDRPLLELLGLDENGEVQLTVSNGSLIVTPVRPRAVEQRQFEESLERVVGERREVLRRLAE